MPVKCRLSLHCGGICTQDHIKSGIIGLGYDIIRLRSLKEQHVSDSANSNTRITTIKKEIVRVMVLNIEIFQNLQSGVYSLNTTSQILQKYVFKNTAKIGLEVR